MEPFITALANAGGMGILAGALLWLHHNAINAFREELRAERAASEKRSEEVVTAIRAQTAILGNRLDQLSGHVGGACRYPTAGK